MRIHPPHHSLCLLVLDNVEDPAQIRRPVTGSLIPAGLPCRLLFTTRRRDVGDAQALELSVLPPDTALRLLLRHEHRRPILDPRHPDHSAAQQICTMLGRLPLALELAGAFLGEWPDVSLGGYRQRLQQEGRLSTLDAEAAELEGSSLSGIHDAAVAATLGGHWDALAGSTEAGEDARLLLCVAGQLPEAALIPTARLGLLGGVLGREVARQAQPLRPCPTPPAKASGISVSRVANSARVS